MRRTIAVFLVTLVVYAATAFPHNGFDEQSRQAYAWLHGRMDIDAPDSFLEHAEFQGRKFALHPPMSPILLIPVVAISGRGTNQVWPCVVLGAVDVTLAWMLFSTILSQGASEAGRAHNPVLAGSTPVPATNAGVAQRIEQSPYKRPTQGSTPSASSNQIWLTAFFAFGTSFWYETAVGNTWSWPGVVGMLFTLLALNELLGKRRGLLVGLWAGMAFLGEYQYGFCVPVYLWMVWRDPIRL
jgi:hypothetical protein